MSSEKTVKTDSLKADVVVIGGGGAGLVAAVAAAEKGAKNVVVLEARKVTGGNAVYAISMFNMGKPSKNRQAIQKQKDELFLKAMEFTHWRSSGGVVRALIDKSEDIVFWLEAKGVKFELPPDAPSGLPVPFFIQKPGGPRIGAIIAETLTRKCREMGVQILYQTRAKKLVTDRSGRVVGVLAVSRGKELKISAKSVIIATGGFTGDKKLMKKYMPPYQPGDDVFIGGIPHKGDGLLMATEVGASTEVTTSPECSVNRMPWSALLFLLVKHPKTLWVNKKGERFVNESAQQAYNGQFRQPDMTVYTILDEKTKQSIYGEELTPIDKFVLASDMTLDVIDEKIQKAIRKEGLYATYQNWPEVTDKDLKWQAKNGRVKIADSWEGIARWIGADPKVLKATIDEYNAACAGGHDTAFAKDKEHLLPLRTPPYYAIRCFLNVLVTHGGIKINEEMEVLDGQGDPIPGLYAAGVEAATADTDTYCPIGAHGFGFAVNSGRIAGESAAKAISGR